MNQTAKLTIEFSGDLADSLRAIANLVEEHGNAFLSDPTAFFSIFNDGAVHRVDIDIAEESERCEHTGMTCDELESICGTGEVKSGWRKEFPEFDHDLDALAKRLKDEFGFYDSSWHNDACPSFSAIDDSLRIWVNWSNPDLREGWDNLYGIDLPGEEDSVNDTDDLEEAIAVIKALIAEKSERKVNGRLSGIKLWGRACLPSEATAIIEQRADAKITELIRDVKDGDCALSAIFDDGSKRKLFSFYIDELAFFDADLIGKTEMEAHQLHHARTVAYLQS